MLEIFSLMNIAPTLSILAGLGIGSYQVKHHLEPAPSCSQTTTRPSWMASIFGTHPPLPLVFLLGRTIDWMKRVSYTLANSVYLSHTTASGMVWALKAAYQVKHSILSQLVQGAGQIDAFSSATSFHQD